LSRTLLAFLRELGELNRKQITAMAEMAPFNHDSGSLRALLSYGADAQSQACSVHRDRRASPQHFRHQNFLFAPAR
jgi:hypothetical protein